MTNKYSAEHLTIFLIHLLKNITFASLALPVIEAHYICASTIGGTRWHGIIFSIIKLYYQRYDKSIPDLATVSTELKFILEKYVTDKNEKELALAKMAEFIILYNIVDERSLPMAREIVQYIAKVCVLQPKVCEMLTEATSGGSVVGLTSQLQVLEAQHLALRGGISSTGVMSRSVSTGDRCPSGISWIDSRVGGGLGLTLGCGIGIIGPQGGGKTTIGIQLGVEQATSDRHALLVLVEEGLTASIQRKIMAAATGISTLVLESATKSSDGQVDLKIAAEKSSMNYELVKKRIDLVNKNLHILDLVEKYGDLDVIAGEIQHLINVDMKPIYTYIDWAGILASRIQGADIKSKTDALTKISYETAILAQRNNIIIAVSQQMARDNARKGAFAENDHYSAADCRGFTEPYKYCFVINPRDKKSGLQIFSISKSRDDAPTTRFLVRLRGEIAHFEDVASQYELRGRHIIDKNKSPTQRNVVPQ